ncbi:hypothetical protein HDU82_006131 [Entophlyctis luteolus]|nr:hypothetical protein HDU82_006131 [Entophlyctis luteolus]KAJ3377269.1 hypothetical protein HDU84_008837 [Entophlyctis sp. JEL0112]
MCELLIAVAYCVRYELLTSSQETIYQQIYPFIKDYAPLATLPLSESPNWSLLVLQHVQQYANSKFGDNLDKRYLFFAFTDLTESLTQLNRIRETSVPRAYAVHLWQLLLVYLLSLPFQLVDSTGWLTVPIVVVTTYMTVGIVTIAEMIENPFGTNSLDLPTDLYCEQIRDAVFAILRRTESVDEEFEG